MSYIPLQLSYPGSRLACIRLDIAQGPAFCTLPGSLFLIFLRWCTVQKIKMLQEVKKKEHHTPNKRDLLAQEINFWTSSTFARSSAYSSSCVLYKRVNRLKGEDLSHNSNTCCISCIVLLWSRPNYGVPAARKTHAYNQASQLTWNHFSAFSVNRVAR